MTHYKPTASKHRYNDNRVSFFFAEMKRKGKERETNEQLYTCLGIQSTLQMSVYPTSIKFTYESRCIEMR